MNESASRCLQDVVEYTQYLIYRFFIGDSCPVSGASIGKKKGGVTLGNPVAGVPRVLGIYWNIELSADPEITLEHSIGKEVCSHSNMSNVSVPKVSLCWNAVQGGEDLCRVNCTLGNFCFRCRSRFS
jgi:hypothetical protein